MNHSVSMLALLALLSLSACEKPILFVHAASATAPGQPEPAGLQGDSGKGSRLIVAAPVDATLPS